MDKYNKLALNTVIFTIGSFGSKLLSYFLVILYNNYLSPESNSLVDIIRNTGNLLIPIGFLCASEAVLRFGLDKRFRKDDVFTSALLISFCGLAVLALLSPAFHFVDALQGHGFILYVFVYTSCFRQVCSQFVRARNQLKLFALDGILATLSLLIFNIIFMAVLKLGVVGFFISLILSDFCSILFLCYISDLGRCLKLSKPNFPLIKQMLAYSAPLVPAMITWWIINVSDRFFVVEMVSEEANGIYGYAYKIPALVMMVTGIFQQAWQISAIDEMEKAGSQEFYRKVYNIYQSIMFVAAAGIMLICLPLTTILAGTSYPEYLEAYVYIPTLTIATIFMCFGTFLSSIYAATKRSVNSMLTSFAAAAANIILNALLIPKMGVHGAAIATLVSYLLCYILRITDTRRYIYFKVNHLKTILNTAAISVMGCSIVFDLKGKWIFLVLGFIVVLLLNLREFMQTLRAFLRRGRKGGAKR